MSGVAMLLRVRGLVAGYPGAAAPALDGVELEVPAGARVAVLGPNGSGKSTLFAAIVGGLRPQSGTVELGGSVAYLPQQLNIDPTFPVTVRDVVAMGRWGKPRWFGRLSSGDRELIDAAIDALGIGPIAGERLGELSGGQRQRALLAQTMAEDARVILLDEPLTGVDRPTAEAIDTLIEGWRADGRAVLIATHDLDAARECDLVLALNRRQIAFGSPDVACTEEVLSETFDGHVVRIDGELVDTSHRHPGAA